MASKSEVREEFSRRQTLRKHGHLGNRWEQGEESATQGGVGKSIESQKRKSGRCQNKLQERVKGLQSLVPTAKVKYCYMPKAPAIKRRKHVMFIMVFSRKQVETRMRICGKQ